MNKKHYLPNGHWVDYDLRTDKPLGLEGQKNKLNEIKDYFFSYLQGKISSEYVFGLQTNLYPHPDDATLYELVADLQIFPKKLITTLADPLGEKTAKLSTKSDFYLLKGGGSTIEEAAQGAALRPPPPPPPPGILGILNRSQILHFNYSFDKTIQSTILGQGILAEKLIQA